MIPKYRKAKFLRFKEHVKYNLDNKSLKFLLKNMGASWEFMHSYFIQTEHT